jgi:hypothetical protein
MADSEPQAVARRFPMTDKPDAKTVLEKWRPDIDVSGMRLWHWPAAGKLRFLALVTLWDALAASEAEAQVLRARMEALEKAGRKLAEAANEVSPDYESIVDLREGLAVFEAALAALEPPGEVKP